MLGFILSFLQSLADAKKYTLVVVLILAILASLCVLVAILSKFIKFLIKISPKIKLGDKEFSIQSKGDDKQNLKETPAVNLRSNVEIMINAAMETGYLKCRKRQELFDSQMRYLYSTLRNYQNQVIKSLLETDIKDVYVQDTISSTLKDVLNQIIILKFRQVFMEDRLASLSQDTVVDKNKYFIENLPQEISFAMDRKLALSGSKEVREAVKIALENNKRILQNSITMTLEKAWEEAKTYLQIINMQNEQLHKLVSEKASCIVGDIEEIAGAWWESTNDIPPLDIITKVVE